MKIGLFTDSHYFDKEVAVETRRPRLSYPKVKEAMEHFKENGVEQVICLGDFTDGCGNAEEDVKRVNEMMNLIRSYDIPFYCMMGNHDYQIYRREEFDFHTKGSYPPFLVNFGKNTFVFLDANYTEDGRVYVKGHVDWTIAYVPEFQIEKLKNVLNDESVESVYVFVHQNLDPGVEEHHIIKNAECIREIIRNSGKVKKVIQGHFHWGHDAIVDGIEYHTLPAMCEGERNYFEIMEID